MYMFYRHLDRWAKVISLASGCRHTVLTRCLGSPYICGNACRDEVYKFNRQCMKTKSFYPMVIQTAGEMILSEGKATMTRFAQQQSQI